MTLIRSRPIFNAFHDDFQIFYGRCTSVLVGPKAGYPSLPLILYATGLKSDDCSGENTAGMGGVEYGWDRLQF